MPGRSRNAPPPRRIASLVVALALTGCGSTLQLHESSTAGTSPDAGLSVGSPSSATPSDGSGDAIGTGGIGATSPTGTTTTAQSTGAGTGRGDDSSPAATGGTRSQVQVGVIYLGGLSGPTAAVGGSADTGDSKAEYEAVFNYLAAHAGNGPKLMPSYYAINASSNQPVAVQLQAACQHFTHDHPVDIVLTYTLDSGNVLSTCLSHTGTPLVNGYSQSGPGAATFASNPTLWAPAQITLDRLGKLLPTYLISNHWVAGKWGGSCPTVAQPRIGVVTFDRPEYRAAYDHELAPTFKRLGHPVYDAVFMTISGSTAQQLAEASSAVQSAVLKFASECIDHVVMVSQVVIDYLFMDVASSQGYHPRYGLSSLEAGPVLIPSLTDPRTQLHGAMGPGWAPYSDVAIADLDATAKRPAAKCMAILKHARVAPTDNNSAILALPACEGPFFVAKIVTNWPASASSAELLNIVNSLGRSYRPVGTYVSEFSSSQHDGAADFRGFAFQDGCTCFRYTSGLQRM